MKHTNLIHISKQTIALLVIFIILLCAGLGIAFAKRMEIEKERKGLSIKPEDITLSYNNLNTEAITTIQDKIGHNPNAYPYLNGHPEHIHYVFTAERFANEVFPRKPELFIYPREKYRGLYQAKKIAHFDTIISLIESAIAIGDETIQGEIPILPATASKQLIHAKEMVIPFTTGNGIRFIAQYGKPGDLIEKNKLAYIYQGRTEDKKYHVSLFFPFELNDSSLQDTDMTPEEKELLKDMEIYKIYTDEKRTMLQALDETAFTPKLEEIDMVIRSLVIQ